MANLLKQLTGKHGNASPDRSHLLAVTHAAILATLTRGAIKAVAADPQGRPAAERAAQR